MAETSPMRGIWFAISLAQGMSRITPCRTVKAAAAPVRSGRDWRRSVRPLRAALVMALVVVVGIGSVLATRAVSDSSGEDVFMEPAATVGPHPFTTEALGTPAAAVAPAPPPPT